jgi:hypothetical protein
MVTYDLFFSVRRQAWGLRDIIDGDCKRIRFHADLFFILHFLTKVDADAPITVSEAR